MQFDEKCCDINLTKEDNSLVEKEFPSSLLRSIDEIIKKEGYETYQVDKRSITTGGGNFLSVLYEVDVKGKTAEGEKETNVFIKNMLHNEKFTALSVSDAFSKECYVYNELFNIYSDLQNEAKVPIKERFKSVNSFHSSSDAIFLENMTKKGFRTLNRFDVMPLKFAELSVQQLAKFHGLSLVLEKRNPDYFDRKLKNMKTAFSFNDDWHNFSMRTCETAFELLDENRKEKIRKYIPTVAEKNQRYLTETTLGCLCHCDYRQSNILITETDGEITEVIPVDYQLIHYGCPLNDLVFFIINTSDQDFRKKHMTYLKNMYYDTLEHFLWYFAMDVSVIFPRKEFERLYEERLDYGLVIAMSLLPLFFTSEDDVPDIGADDVNDKKLKVDSKFIERIRGIVDDYVQWGYL